MINFLLRALILMLFSLQIIGSNTKQPLQDVVIRHEHGVEKALISLSKKKAPLIVSLHTWSGDYLQEDLLLDMIIESDYNYIRPNFQGPNNNVNACLSDLVIYDLDAAIDWISKFPNVDKTKIILIGSSGGGYTALGYQAKTKHDIFHTFAWAPITDLTLWLEFLKDKGKKYYDDVLNCSISQDFNSDLKKRSPINYANHKSKKITLYAGINDGHEGTVPINQSINYFNKFAKEKQKITDEVIQNLITRNMLHKGKIHHDSAIYLDQNSDKYRIIIFDGGHEFLPKIAFKEIKEVLK